MFTPERRALKILFRLRFFYRKKKITKTKRNTAVLEGSQYVRREKTVDTIKDYGKDTTIAYSIVGRKRLLTTYPFCVQLCRNTKKGTNIFRENTAVECS